MMFLKFPFNLEILFLYDKEVSRGRILIEADNCFDYKTDWSKVITSGQIDIRVVTCSTGGYASVS